MILAHACKLLSSITEYMTAKQYKLELRLSYRIIILIYILVVVFWCYLCGPKWVKPLHVRLPTCSLKENLHFIEELVSIKGYIIIGELIIINGIHACIGVIHPMHCQIMYTIYTGLIYSFIYILLCISLRTDQYWHTGQSILLYIQLFYGLSGSYFISLYHHILSF